MESQENKINRNLLVGWCAIIIILFVAYLGEVLKGQRTIPYMVLFMICTAIPALMAVIVYKKGNNTYQLRYWIIVGYFIMYAFVMFTGSTNMVFTYIFPMLSLIVLYHQPMLVLAMGISALAFNIIFLFIRILNNEITTENSKDVEIQFALLILCFSGSYVASRLYDDITKKNIAYLKTIDDKTRLIEKMTMQSITTIANTIDAKDEYTKGHSHRVAEYSSEIACALGATEEQIYNINSIALLHDIGKIGIPDAVLNKKGKLNDTEYNIMKQHPTVGAEILKDIRIIDNLDTGAKYHHERFDGKGYPSGLAGEEIPMVARIIGVADAFDAMNSDRVYRKRLPMSKIISELERGSGTQFDPHIVEVFVKQLKSKMQQDTMEISSLEERKSEKGNIDKFIKESLEKGILDELADAARIRETEKNIIVSLKSSDGCLILVDVDNLGDINTKFGYLRGDYCLLIIADVLTDSERNLYVSRVEGDQFLCYMPNINSFMEAEEAVMQLMNDIRCELGKHMEAEEVTVSAGVAVSTISGKDYNRLYHSADKALYYRKESGKDGFYIFNDEEKHHRDYEAKEDINNLVKFIQSEYNYEGAYQVEYSEFKQLYEFIKKICERNSQSVQLILFTIESVHEKHFSIQDRNYAMKVLETAIIENVRTVDVTTRYSSNQQLVTFMNLSEANIDEVVGRMLKAFYKMYDKEDVVLNYEVAELDR